MKVVVTLYGGEAIFYAVLRVVIIVYSLWCKFAIYYQRTAIILFIGHSSMSW